MSLFPPFFRYHAFIAGPAGTPAGNQLTRPHNDAYKDDRNDDTDDDILKHVEYAKNGAPVVAKNVAGSNENRVPDS